MCFRLGFFSHEFGYFFVHTSTDTLHGYIQRKDGCWYRLFFVVILWERCVCCRSSIAVPVNYSFRCTLRDFSFTYQKVTILNIGINIHAASFWSVLKSLVFLIHQWLFFCLIFFFLPHQVKYIAYRCAHYSHQNSCHNDCINYYVFFLHQIHFMDHEILLFFICFTT